MSKKNYLIIGGSSGIGKALTRSLSNNGHHLFSTYNRHPFENSENVTSMPYDVLSETAELANLPDVLDGLVYCPGSINLMPFKRIKTDEFRADFDLQVIGAIKVIQSVLPKLRKGVNPSIVMFSTVAVQSGFNFHTQVAVSKGAIEGLTKSLSAELAPAIRVNAIAPSLTNTPLAEKLLSNEDKIAANANRHPLKKIGQPEDIAEMASFLLSDKAQWISGQIIHVDGGMSTIKL